MENVEHIKYRNPLILQMVIAGIVSIAATIVSVCFFALLVSVMDGSKFGHEEIAAVISLSTASLIVYVPLCLSSLLFLHLTGIYKYIMYSKRMVVLESSLLVMLDLIICWSMKALYFKTVLFSSLIILVIAALLIKKVFNQRYLHFQEELERCYVRPNIEENIDISLTVVIIALLLIPSLFFVFVFFQ